jgi:hypothetical protein
VWANSLLRFHPRKGQTGREAGTQSQGTAKSNDAVVSLVAEGMIGVTQLTQES